MPLALSGILSTAADPLSRKHPPPLSLSLSRKNSARNLHDDATRRLYKECPTFRVSFYLHATNKPPLFRNYIVTICNGYRECSSLSLAEHAKHLLSSNLYERLQNVEYIYIANFIIRIHNSERERERERNKVTIGIYSKQSELQFNSVGKWFFLLSPITIFNRYS